MKKFRSIIALVLCACLLCACGGNADEPSTEPSASVPAETNYSVTVTDPLGTPCGTGVIVNFIRDGQTAAIQALDATGTAAKTLPTGDYTVELSFADANARYHYDAILLTAENVSATVILSQLPTVETKVISTYSPDTGELEEEYTTDLYYVEDGCTYVELSGDDRNYFYFVPSESGLYRFSIMGCDAGIGYYGSPYFIQDSNLAEMADDGSFQISVSDGMIGTDGTGTSAFVLGVDTIDGESGILCIQRVGEPIKTVEDYEWSIYETTAVLAPFTLPENAILHEFDLTASGYTLVLSEADGCYHLNTADGPVVYAKLGASSNYLDSIETILEASGFTSYFYDEDGNFDRKESYTQCLMEYLGCMDEASGLYPLTEDLVYIFRSRGEYVGWWDINSGIYLFVDAEQKPIAGINPDIAWLFLCCYGEEQEPEPAPIPDPTPDPVPTPDPDPVPTPDPEPTPDPKPTPDPVPTPDPEPVRTVGKHSSADPVEMGRMEYFTATVNGGEYADYIIYRMTSNVFMTIYSDDAYVIYNGKTYWAENGVLKVELKGSTMSSAVSLSIGNAGSETVTFDVYLGTNPGSFDNPFTLNIGSNTANVAAGDEVGVYFAYVVTADGSMTFTIDSATNNAAAHVVINVTTDLITHQYYLEQGESVTISVAAGDILSLAVSTSDQNDAYSHPASTVKFTVTMN